MWKSQSSVAPLQDKDFFQIPKFALTLFGWWTKDGEGLPFYFYINYLSLLLSSVVISSYGVIHIDNIPLAFDAFCPSATEVVSSIKMSSVLYFRKEYQSLLSSLFRFFKDEKSPNNIKILRKETRFAHFFCIPLLFFGGGTCCTYYFQPLIIYLFQQYTGRPIVRELPFKAVYPFFDAYAYPYYIWCYIHLCHGAFCTVAGFVGMDGLFLTICCNITAQFKIITQRITTLIEDNIDDTKANIENRRPLTRDENAKIYGELRKILLRHYEIMDITERLLEVYTINIFAHFLSAAMIFCFASINLLLVANGPLAILYILYNLAVAVQLFVYSMGGTRISASSCYIADACYDFHWIRCDKNVRMLLLLMIQRSQRGTKVKVPFFEVSLPAYTKIMSSAGSYIALLKSFL